MAPPLLTCWTGRSEYTANRGAPSWVDELELDDPDVLGDSPHDVFAHGLQSHMGW